MDGELVAMVECQVVGTIAEKHGIETCKAMTAEAWKRFSARNIELCEKFFTCRILVGNEQDLAGVIIFKDEETYRAVIGFWKEIREILGDEIVDDLESNKQDYRIGPGKLMSN